jgi:hypothetical protein
VPILGISKLCSPTVSPRACYGVAFILTFNSPSLYHIMSLMKSAYTTRIYLVKVHFDTISSSTLRYPACLSGCGCHLHFHSCCV